MIKIKLEFPQLKSKQLYMGSSQCTPKARGLSKNCSGSNLNRGHKKNISDVTHSSLPIYAEGSTIRINLRRKTGIFEDISCPIDNQTLQQLEKQLRQFQIPYLGVSGDYDSVWKKVKLREKGNWWYIGEWKSDKMHGKGSLYCKQYKFLITGLFVLDKIITTKCRIIFQNGSYYMGSINQFYQAEGYGEMHFKNGSKYIGNFISGLPNGSGKQIKELFQFYGTFQNGIKKYGTLNDQTGTYEGQFQNNLKHGIGKITTKNGDKIHAQFSMNKVVRKLQSIPQNFLKKKAKFSGIR